MAEAAIRDRMPKGLIWVKGRDLLPHPQNFRQHPPHQAEAVRQLRDTLGWYKPLTVRELGGGKYQILDGHLRHSLDPDADYPAVPTDLTEDEGKVALRQTDRLSVFAEIDEPKLEGLNADIGALVDAALLPSSVLLDDLLLGSIDDPEPAAAGVPDLLSRTDVPDALFPTDNEWQIPTLDVKRQADALDMPAVAWGSVARTARMRGTWHFYTEDYRYQAIWADPSPIPNTGCVNAVEPNFSLYEETPRAVALYRIYQKRWIARWWQSQGIRVLADLNVAEPFADLNLLGIPEGWRAYATRGYTERMDATEREYAIACERAGGDDILFFVYGGGKKVASLCGKRGWLHVDEHMNRRGKDG